MTDNFRLGYVDVPAMPEHKHAKGCLAIPYLTPKGVRGFVFRKLEPEAKPKYLSHHGIPRRLFNPQAFFEAGSFICISEGEMDAMTLWAAGLPAVGVPGVNGWDRKVHPRCFEGFERVLVFGDSDDRPDGSNPGQILVDAILGSVNQAEHIRLPLGQDVNSLYMKEGPSVLRALASAS